MNKIISKLSFSTWLSMALCLYMLFTLLLPQYSNKYAEKVIFSVFAAIMMTHLIIDAVKFIRGKMKHKSEKLA